MSSVKQSYVSRKIEPLIKKIKKGLSRRATANLMMVSFILFTAIGCFLVYVPAGFICAGISCGLFGFLLGQE